MLRHHQNVQNWSDLSRPKAKSQMAAEALNAIRYLAAKTYHNADTTYLTIDSWMRTFISKLPHITHDSQWIYRNNLLHHARLGVLEKKERGVILVEIDRLAVLGPVQLPEESKFLLEIDFEQLRDDKVEGNESSLPRGASSGSTGAAALQQQTGGSGSG